MISSHVGKETFPQPPTLLTAVVLPWPLLVVVYALYFVFIVLWVAAVVVVAVLVFGGALIAELFRRGR